MNSRPSGPSSIAGAARHAQRTPQEMCGACRSRWLTPILLYVVHGRLSHLKSSQYEFAVPDDVASSGFSATKQPYCIAPVR
jgi:hypothetical protein